MSSKKAYEQESKVKKLMFFTRKIEELIEQVKTNPLSTDYSGELEKLHHEFPKDRAIILQAERDAYKAVRNGK